MQLDSTIRQSKLQPFCYPVSQVVFLDWVSFFIIYSPRKQIIWNTYELYRTKNLRWYSVNIDRKFILKACFIVCKCNSQSWIVQPLCKFEFHNQFWAFLSWEMAKIVWIVKWHINFKCLPSKAKSNVFRHLLIILD